MDGDEGLTVQSYGKIFEQLCPYYMSIGMSYDDFWNGDVSMVKAYRLASELRDKRMNQELWLQGRYIYDALCSVSPLFRFSTKAQRSEPYVNEPYPITAAEVREREERKAREEEERFKAEFALYVERLRKKMSQETPPDDGR